MELSKFELAAIKKTAQITKQIRRKLDKLNEKKVELLKEIEEIQKEVDLWESPIVTKYGYYSEQILSGNIEKDSNNEEKVEKEEESIEVENIENTEEKDPFLN